MKTSPELHRPHRRKRVLVLLAWYSNDIFRGIARFARDADWIIDCTFARTGETPATWRGDGIIGVFGVHREVDAFSLKAGVPFVNIGYSMPEVAPSVSADQAGIARLASSHFRNRGFRNFAYYLKSNQPGDVGRLEAFRKELAATGNELVVLKCEGNDNRSLVSRLKALGRQLRQVPKPVGVLSEIDDYALEVMGAAQEAGMKIPEEVAVLGVGNDEIRCPLASVPLSSVDDNAHGIGQQAALLLEQLMNGFSVPRKSITVPARAIVTRQSTDILAVEHPQVAKAIKAIREQYMKPITAEGVISGVPMSRRRLHDAFLRCIGRSAADELTRLRVEHAKRMLAETSEKQSQIAIQSGFNSQARLVLVFSRLTGMSPGQFRHMFNPAFSHSPKPGRPPGSKARET